MPGNRLSSSRVDLSVESQKFFLTPFDAIKLPKIVGWVEGQNPTFFVDLLGYSTLGVSFAYSKPLLRLHSVLPKLHHSLKTRPSLFISSDG